MRYALLPGSYDPITIGHLDIIRRAQALFGRVTVLVARNSAKNYLLCSQKRLALVEDAVKDLSNVSAESYDGMLFDYLGAHPDAVLVKGIRSEKDYLYEQEMAQANHELCRRKYGFEAETLFLPCSPCYANVSSTLVRILAANGGDYSDLVPNPVLLRDYLASSLSNN